MPVSDRREPGVYVSIEDASFVAPPAEVGRTVFGVVLCDRGRHNQVVTITSQEQFHKEFGTPDFTKCSQSHYVLDKAIQYTGKMLVVRAVNESAKLASVAIKETSDPSAPVGTSTDFTFTEFTDTKPSKREDRFWESWDGSGTATYNNGRFLNDDYQQALIAWQQAYSDACKVDFSGTEVVFEQVNIGDWIYPDQIPYTHKIARQVIGKDYEANKIILDKPLDTGTTGWGTITSSVYIYTPLTTSTDGLNWNTNYTSEMDVSADTVFQFYTRGVGKYYNNLKIKGARNVELEKMYMDSNNNVMYKYLFMDIGVYLETDDGDMLMEGPWTVSLSQRTQDNKTIRDLASGQNLFIEDVINKNSEMISCVAGTFAQELMGTDSELSEMYRLHTTLSMSFATPVGTTNYVPLGNALFFDGGFDGFADSDSDSGTPMYDPNTGNLYVDNLLYGKVKQAFMGSLPSVDGSIEVLREVTYPWYEPDYVVSGGFPAWVQDGARQYANYRQDVFHLGDSGYNVSTEQDLESRLEDVPWNNWTSMLYTQYRERMDAYTGKKMTITPVFHAIERHLDVDAQYFLGEPVANIEKGAIAEPIKLAYRPNHTERGDLLENELNYTIVEAQGKYFATQFTTWKRLSILKRAHAAKFVCYCRKMLPPLLKDLLQRKATSFWINQAQIRVNYFFKKFVDSPVERYKILDEYSADVVFDDVASELNIYVRMKPVRVIERINVHLIVS